MGRVDPSAGTVQPAFRALLDLLRLEGAWIKLSGAERMVPHPYDGALPFARALADARPDRILWGTDYPHPNLKANIDERDLVDLIPSYAVDTETRHRKIGRASCRERVCQYV